MRFFSKQLVLRASEMLQVYFEIFLLISIATMQYEDFSVKGYLNSNKLIIVPSGGFDAVQSFTLSFQ